VISAALQFHPLSGQMGAQEPISKLTQGVINQRNCFGDSVQPCQRVCAKLDQEF
jgi:hypothetical protein